MGPEKSRNFTPRKQTGEKKPNRYGDDCPSWHNNCFKEEASEVKQFTSFPPFEKALLGVMPSGAFFRAVLGNPTGSPFRKAIGESAEGRTTPGDDRVGAFPMTASVNPRQWTGRVWAGWPARLSGEMRSPGTVKIARLKCQAIDDPPFPGGVRAGTALLKGTIRCDGRPWQCHFPRLIERHTSRRKV